MLPAPTIRPEVRCTACCDASKSLTNAIGYAGKNAKFSDVPRSDSEDSSADEAPMRRQSPSVPARAQASPRQQKVGGALDWLSNLEQDMNAVKGQISKLQTPKQPSPAPIKFSPNLGSNASQATDQAPRDAFAFIKKSDRVQVTPPPVVVAPAPAAPVTNADSNKVKREEHRKNAASEAKAAKVITYLRSGGFEK
jgi:hypothetical protein